MEVIMQQPPWQQNQPPPYQQPPTYYPPPQQPYFQPPPMMVQPPPKRRLHGCLIAAVVFIALGICGLIVSVFEGPQSSTTSATVTPTAQVTDTPLTDISDIDQQVHDDITNANLQGDDIHAGYGKKGFTPIWIGRKGNNPMLTYMEKELLPTAILTAKPAIISTSR
jgi:hypothetical protein